MLYKTSGYIFCFCFVLFCFVLFCFVLFCFVLFCFVLFCLFVCLHLFSLHLFVPVFLLFMEMRVRWRGYLVKKDPARKGALHERRQILSKVYNYSYYICKALVVKIKTSVL